MPRKLPYLSLLGLSLIWVAITVTQAAGRIGDPLRWVDVFILFAFSFLAGTFYQRAMVARRNATVRPPEIPGGPPTAPK